jgi:hypothetical protein
MRLPIRTVTAFSSTISLVVAAIVFFLFNVLLAVFSRRAFFGFVRGMPARFPSPSE